MSHYKSTISSKVNARVEALSEAEAHYESIIEGGGQYSTHSDELISNIQSDSLARIWLVGVWLFLGLVTNSLVLVPRFAWMTLVVVPIISELIIRAKVVQSWVIWIFLSIEGAAGLAPAFPLTVMLLYRTGICVLSGTHCPVGDDSQVKRAFELVADIMITLYTFRVCLLLVKLGLGYQRAQDEQERADSIKEDIQGKLV